ncbi:DUF3558 family protein [Saccharomonospora cyanea]|uniref:DUF3558 family protein n=1 Tax=Saccharomonospora cyanea TaxID=40989 RepID=UPI001E645C9F|nr:DUF3558 family protein [Saccharomonospora cyanea]
MGIFPVLRGRRRGCKAFWRCDRCLGNAGFFRVFAPGGGFCGVEITFGRTGVSGPFASSSSFARPASLSIDPCGLISAEDLAEVGEFETEYQEGGGSRYCVWQEGFESGGNGFGFSVGVRDSQGIDAVRDIGGGVDPTEVNQRPAVKTEDPVSGDCMLAVKISDSSRIDVTVLGEDGDGDSCGLAEVIAGMVEPRLPELP